MGELEAIAEANRHATLYVGIRPPIPFDTGFLPTYNRAIAINQLIYLTSFPGHPSPQPERPMGPDQIPLGRGPLRNALGEVILLML
jgi:hypothetical protein